MARKSIEFCPYFDRSYGGCVVDAEIQNLPPTNGTDKALQRFNSLLSDILPKTWQLPSRRLGRVARMCAFYRRASSDADIVKRQSTCPECLAMKQFLKSLKTPVLTR